MKINKKLALAMFIIIALFIGIAKIYSEEVKSYTSSISDLEKIKGNTIEKKYDGSYMEPLITVLEPKSDFNIELDGISKGHELMLINPNTGEMISMDYSEDGKYKVNTNLEQDIDYGIILDGNLTGSITVVENLKNVNDKELYDKIMKNLECGL